MSSNYPPGAEQELARLESQQSFFERSVEVLQRDLRNDLARELQDVNAPRLLPDVLERLQERFPELILRTALKDDPEQLLRTVEQELQRCLRDIAEETVERSFDGLWAERCGK